MTKKKKPTIQFIGNNSKEVTGSMTSITLTNGRKIVLECGFVQGGTLEEDYKANINALNNVDLQEYDYIFLLDNHIDHTGNIPRCVKNGFQGKIISPYKVAHFLEPMWEDCAFIGMRNIQYLEKTYKRKFDSIYDSCHVKQTLDMVYEYGYSEVYELDNNIKFRYLTNNHTISSASLELWLTDESNHTYKIFYSGDLGNVAFDRPYYMQLEKCDKANVAIFESTYGNRDEYITSKDRKKEIKLLKKTIINTVLGKQGNVLIPSFSFCRSQEIFTILHDLFHEDERFNEVDFIVDSKLTKEITKRYMTLLEGEDKEKLEKVLAWKNLKQISDYQKETLEVLKNPKPKVLISSSGFCENGHIVEYIKKYIQRKNNTIIFVGYASPQSLAGRIRNQCKTVLIDKTEFEKNCEIITLNAFSSHMQKQDLVNYICGINCEKVVLVHGDKEAKESLKKSCQEKLSEMCKTTQIIISEKNMKVSL